MLVAAVAGNWRLVFRQTWDSSNPDNGNWASWSKNADDPGAADFAILDQLESFRGSDGKIKFKLQWPDLDEGPQIWRQSSNPTTDSSYDGYEAIEVNCNDYSWAGLAYSNVQGSCRIDGSLGGFWFSLRKSFLFSRFAPPPLGL